MDKEETKKEIKRLVEKFRQAEQAGEVKRYSEEDTKKNFIMPLFRSLGWDVDGSEISAEESIAGKRVDYGFYLDGRIQFYLEAKAVREEMDNPKFANQAISYSWNKGVTWAVLTNFASLEIFNAENTDASIASKRFKNISWDEYVERFDELWLLSKEACQQKLLDSEAEKAGKKLKRVSVTAKLVEDLNKARELMSNAFQTWDPKLKSDPNLLDEGVQRVLDRIIFIRVAEDREIEPQTLRPLLHEWEENYYRREKKEKLLYQAMQEKFHELDGIYNSNIFAPHASDSWEDRSNVVEKIIEKFYGKDDYYQYDFKAIPADILGTVYEQYLGHKLTKAAKGDLFGTSDLGVTKDARKRKEQGIYYTPRFIVDYIVENALGPVLEKCTSITDLQKIKVLDPACGSGSFLIKALELIYKKYEKFGRTGQYTKLDILTNNLYGVDLDEQAVEIARLNLLVASLEKREKLPSLTNIRNGNSLISGTDEELKKQFGKNWQDKKRFNWKQEFPEVFKQGGFDVVIGNPPYIDSEEMAKTQPDFRDYCTQKYTVATGNWDLFCIFIEQGIKLLKKEGVCGMIVPNKLISAKYADATRNMLASNNVLALADYSSTAVFNASVYPVVFIVEKAHTESSKLEVVTNQGKEFPVSTSARIFSGEILSEYKDGWAPVFEETGDLDFLDRITRKFPKLETSEPFSVTGAATVGEAYEIKKIIREISTQKKDFKFINTGTIDRYRSLWGIEPTRYLKDSYKEPALSRKDFEKIYPKRYKQATSPKIIIGGMSKFLECSLDEDGEYVPGKSTTIILSKDLNSLKILLGILNSKLISVVYSRMFKSLSLAGGFFRVGTPQIKLLPISLPSGQNAKDFINRVNEALDLNEELGKSTKDSEKWKKIKTDIERTDKEIDGEVYKLYDLTDDEMKTVEDSLTPKV